MHMWEESETYQNKRFQQVMSIAGIGTLLLGVICAYIGDFDPLESWGLGLFLFISSWLIICGVVYLIVKLASYFRIKNNQKNKTDA